MNIDSTPPTDTPLLRYEVHMVSDVAKYFYDHYKYDYIFEQIQSKVAGMECYLVTDISSIFKKTISTTIGLPLRATAPPYLVRLLDNSKKGRKYLTTELNLPHQPTGLSVKQPYHTLKKQYDEYLSNKLLETL